ncbi:hypothetical protein O181_021322 [Austropuccinia psidii MF-1]|uniref:Uncharacterized protein n=1 Tax=Austropuccinia psidii MF-1 TaxID=1389203 RepID=A0A9Q3CFB7_9BASI|nr:hypothetical protein [Austropuccinia psidii MF-1]
MLSNKHTINAHLFSDPSNHTPRGVPNQDALTRTPLWSTMMKAFPRGNGCQDPKQAAGNDSGQLAQSPQVSICPPPLLGHHPMVTSLLHRREVIIRPIKDGDGERTFELGPIVTHGIQMPKFSFSSLTHFTSHNHTDFSPLRIEQNQPSPLLQDSPVPSFPCKQTLRQPTPGPSGTQWLEDLFCGKQPKVHLISTFDSSELTLPAFVEPSQSNEPPIPGPSPSAKPHEDNMTCEPEPEVAPTQSMEEPFGKSQLFLTFPLTISTPLFHHHRRYACRIPPSLHSYPGAKLPSFAQ